MKFQLVVLGDELLQGKTKDANTFWLAKFLFSKGFSLGSGCMIGDNISDIASQFQKSIEENDVTFVTGGLGATNDDLTKFALESAFNLPMEFSQTSFDYADKAYKRYNKSIDENHPYAQMPKGVEFFYNQAGIAPGIMYQKGKNLIICMPGVPSEFQGMIEEDVWPWLEKGLVAHKGCFKKTISIQTKALPEETIFLRKYPDLWEQISSFGRLSSLPHILGVTISVNLEAASEKDLQKKEEGFLAFIKGHEISEYIWQIGDLSIQQYIVKLLTQKKLTLAVSESCTGGLISHHITNVPGASSVYLGSVTSYANTTKEGVLGVKPQSLKKHGAVSECVAEEMATGVRQNLGADIGISTTGIAGPTGGSEEKPVGTIFICVNTKDQSTQKTYQFPGNRIQLKHRFATAALFALLDVLEQI